MRILQIASSGGGNGAVHYCRDLCDALSRRGHDVTLLCPADSWIATRVAPAVRVEFSTFRRVPLDEVRRVTDLVHRAGIEVVQTHLSAGHIFGYLLGRFARVPVVATAHSRRLQPHWALSDRVIAVSDACAVFQSRWNRVRQSRLHTIHNFVDIERFRPRTPDAAARARASLGLGDGPIVGIAGAISRGKRTAVALDACAHAFERVPAARVLVIGTGAPAFVAKLRRRATARGIDHRIMWAGWCDDIASILPAVDVLVTASRDESFSLTSAEAMASAIPVVAAPVPSLRELIGGGGMLAADATAGALGDALASLLADTEKRREMGAVGRARVLARNAPSRQVPRIEDALREAIDWKRRAHPERSRTAC